MIRILTHVPALLSLVLAGPVCAAGPLAPAGAPADAFPKPDRPVAEIVAPRWSSESARDKAGEFTEVARAMGFAPGETVADIGAGSGYYVVRLSPLVRPGGRVLAEDVTPDYLTALETRVKDLANVTVVRGEPHDPRLPPASVDAAILVHMYHEITQPFGLLHNLAAAMRPGGRVGIVDADDIPSRHGTPPALLRCELTAAGYRETGFHPLKDGAYLAVFAAPPADQRPSPETIRPCRDGATRRWRLPGDRCLGTRTAQAFTLSQPKVVSIAAPSPMMQAAACSSDSGSTNPSGRSSRCWPCCSASSA